MQEFNIILRDELQNGLVADPRAARNTNQMRGMTNLKPSPWGAVNCETPTYPLTGNQNVSWPYPQLFRGEDVTIRAYAQTLHAVNESDWSTASITVYDSADPGTALTISASGAPAWRFASFQDCWFLTNGLCLIWSLPSNPDGKVLGTNSLQVTNLCQIDNRLVLCGVADTASWLTGGRFQTLFEVYKETVPGGHFAHEDMAFGTNWIVWSELGGGSSDLPFHNMLMMLGVFGTARFDAMDTLLLHAIEQGDIGFSPAVHPGALLAVAPLGDDVIGFTAHGMTRFQREETRYRSEKVQDVGIMGRCALYSTGREIVWLDATKTLYRWMLGEGINWTHRGWFDAMVAETTMIAFDPHEVDFYIADTNTCFVLSITGLGGPFTIRPMSLYRDDAGTLVGTAKGLPGATPLTFRLVFETMDMNERDNKFCSVLQVQCNGVTGLGGHIAFRYSDQDAFQEFATMSPANLESVIFPGVSFVDGRVILQGTIGDDGCEIQQCEVRYQSEGRRYRRGTKGVQQPGEA